MSSLFYRQVGHGPPLVLLHGFCETHEIWNDFVEPLAERFTVITPDLPGFGKSKLLTSPFSIDQIGDAVAHWLAEEKIAKAMVIGHSLGGYIALAIAENHRNLLRGLGLFHSTAFADTPEKMENRNKVIDFVSRNGVTPYCETFVPGLFFDKASKDIPAVFEIAVKTNSKTLLEYIAAMRDRQDRSFILRDPEIYKLIIAGKGDLLVPIETSREMAKMSQKFAFFELSKVAHMGLFEAKTECQDIITRNTEPLFFNN